MELVGGAVTSSVGLPVVLLVDKEYALVALVDGPGPKRLVIESSTFRRAVETKERDFGGIDRKVLLQLKRRYREMILSAIA